MQVNHKEMNRNENKVKENDMKFKKLKKNETK